MTRCKHSAGGSAGEGLPPIWALPRRAAGSKLDLLDRSRAMHDAHHLDAVIVGAVENEIAPDRPCPSLRSVGIFGRSGGRVALRTLGFLG